jgi:mRNA-degrading endonuclease RelE of RelBE toxin-antitoxin system
MTSDDHWTWKFTPRAADQFDSLDPHVQDRIVSKLDEVVESEWRDPDEFLEPLTGGPFSKLESVSIASPVRSTIASPC